MFVYDSVTVLWDVVLKKAKTKADAIVAQVTRAQ